MRGRDEERERKGEFKEIKSSWKGPSGIELFHAHGLYREGRPKVK